MQFEGQTSKNVHDVRKVCLETTLCVYACFVKFYVFVLDEINVRGPKIIYDHVWVGNTRLNIPKDHPRVLEERPKVGAQDTLPMDGNQRPVGQSMPCWWCLFNCHLRVWESNPKTSLSPRPRTNRMGRRWAIVVGAVSCAQLHFYVRGEVLISRHFQIRALKVN